MKTRTIVTLFLTAFPLAAPAGAQLPLLHSFDGSAAGDHLGLSVSGAGDVDSDGFADFIIGASGDDTGGVNAGAAFVVSGRDGTILYSVFGGSINGAFGSSVSDAGDVDRDGSDDVIIGEPVAGNAIIISGVDGSILRTLSLGESFGTAVAGAGDVNGDGFADQIIGAPHASITDFLDCAAYVFSGRDGALL